MKTSIRILSLVAILATSMLSAKDDMEIDSHQPATLQEAPLVEEPRAGFERPRSKNEKRQQQVKRANQAKALKKKFQNARCLNSKGAPGYAVTYETQHMIRDRSNKGETVEIENGAVFSIRSCDTDRVAGWYKGQSIRIKPNHTWFSSYPFAIYNEITDSSAEAKLSLGPFLTSEYTRKVREINPSNGMVRLDNGSFWRVSDPKALFDWKFDDKVILGDNPGWFTWGYDCIIINLSIDEAYYVTAKRTY